MKEKFIKKWGSLSVLGLHLSEYIPNFTNNYISESNMICEMFIRELRYDISGKIELLKE